jgi:uncharacterized membrane protein
MPSTKVSDPVGGRLESRVLTAAGNDEPGDVFRNETHTAQKTRHSHDLDAVLQVLAGRLPCQRQLWTTAMNASLTAAFVLSVLIGVVSGLRTMTAPAAVSWAARLGWLDLAPTPLAFLGYLFTPWILMVLALTELVVDKLPATPSRTLPAAFGARVVSGGVSGAAIGAASSALVIGMVAGILGAVIGTLGGHAFRAWLAAALGSDRPAALIEDAVAIGGALLVVLARL